MQGFMHLRFRRKSIIQYLQVGIIIFNISKICLLNVIFGPIIPIRSIRCRSLKNTGSSGRLWSKLIQIVTNKYEYLSVVSDEDELSIRNETQNK